MSGKIPDKCAHCGLRVRMKFKTAQATQEHDRAFGELRELYDAKIIKTKYTRRVEMTNSPGDFGDTHFCAVSSSAWANNRKRCKYWTLKIDGAGVVDYLSIYHDRQNYRVAYWGIIIGTIIALGIALFQSAAV